jgi:hypothetical protein
VLGDNLHNELIVNYSTIRDLPTYMGEAFPTIVVNTGGVSFVAGAEEYRHRNQLDQDLIEITDSLTLYKGKHTLIFGTHNEIFKFYNVYIQRSFGKYEFSNLDDRKTGFPTVMIVIIPFRMIPMVRRNLPFINWDFTWVMNGL